MGEDALMQEQIDAQTLSAILRGVGVDAFVGIGEGGALVVYAPNRAQERIARKAYEGTVFHGRAVQVQRAVAMTAKGAA
jgi:hypothetical protein